MARAPRTVAQCPGGDVTCGASRTRFQLVNVEGTSEIVGFEGFARAFLPRGFSLRATVAWARGDTPDPREGRKGRVPLSRVPPVNGTVEAFWRGAARRLYAGAALRWALAQTRLALQDESDARIPRGGTPGFAVIDLRAGYRAGRRVVAGVVLENVTDAAYRYHESSVNGAGRGVVFNVELSL